MSDINRITAETEKFQAAVRKLSNGINQAGVDWNDEKLSKLIELVNNVANNTKSVLQLSESFVGYVKSFDADSSK